MVGTIYYEINILLFHNKWQTFNYYLTNVLVLYTILFFIAPTTNYYTSFVAVPFMTETNRYYMLIIVLFISLV